MQIGSLPAWVQKCSSRAAVLCLLTAASHLPSRGASEQEKGHTLQPDLPNRHNGRQASCSGLLPLPATLSAVEEVGGS